MARTVPTSVPTPVAAAIGLVPAFVDGVLRLPGKAIHVPFIALSGTLAAVGTIRREYDELADRGEQLIAKLRGLSLDEVEDQLEDLVEDTPLAAAYERVEDTLEDVRDDVTERAGKLRAVVTDLAPGTSPAKAPATSGAARPVTPTPATPVPAAQRPKGVPTPKASEPDSTRIDTAASRATVTAVEKAVEKSGAPTGELPLPDYDHMTLGSLRGRLRSLSVEQLVALRTYEKAHADRLPVVTMLDNRIAKLATDAASGTGGTS